MTREGERALLGGVSSLAPLAHDDARPEGSPVATVVFLHGFPLDRRLWRRQLASLPRAGVRVVALDLPGFGGARTRARPPSIEAMASEVAATIDTLGLSRPIVCGLSMGGYVALALARGWSDRIGGLVLADTRASADSEAARAGREANIERARSQGASAVFASMIPNVFASDARREVVDELAQIAASQSVEGVVAALEAMRDRPDLTGSLPALRLPTTVVVGARDVLTPPSEAESMARAIPGARAVIVPEAAHFPNVDNPGAFDAALLDAARR